MRRTVIVVVLAGAAAFVFVLQLVSQRSAERRMRALEERYGEALADASDTPAPAEPLPSLPRAPMAPLVPLNQGPASEPPVAAPPAKATSDRPSEESVPTPQDQVAYVGSIFSNQRPDQGWASATEQTIGTAMRKHAGNSSVESLECRSTLCRARIVHRDEDGFQAFIVSSIVGPTRYWKGAIQSLRDEDTGDGRIRSTMFFMKEGQDMPFLE